MRNIFLENLCTKYGEETIFRLFLKNQKEYIRGLIV